MTNETYKMLKAYGISDDYVDAVYEVWKFISRVAVVMQERYNNEDLRSQKIDDFRLIDSRTEIKNGMRIKVITLKKEIPFRTRFLFNNHFTATGKASDFFNPFNETNSVKWLFENHINKVAKWNLRDWVDTGRIAHISAIESNYSTANNSNTRKEL